MSLKEYNGFVKMSSVIKRCNKTVIVRLSHYLFSKGWMINKSSLSRFIRYFSRAYFSMAEALNCKSLENFRLSAICFSKYNLDCFSSFNSPFLCIWVKTSFRSKKSIQITKAVVASKNLFRSIKSVRLSNFIWCFLRGWLKIEESN